MKLSARFLLICSILLPSVYLQGINRKLNAVESKVKHETIEHVTKHPSNHAPRVPANVHAVQQILDGLAAQSGHRSPNITSCLDEGSAISIIYFLNNILDGASNKELLNIPERISEFKEGANAQISECITSNRDFQGVLEGLHAKDVPIKDLFVKSVEYSLTGNYDTLILALDDIKLALNEGRYENVGRLSGKLINTIATYQSDTEIDVTETIKPVSAMTFVERMMTQMKKLQLYWNGWSGNYGNIGRDNDFRGGNYDNDYDGNGDYDDTDYDNDYDGNYDDFNDSYDGYNGGYHDFGGK